MWSDYFLDTELTVSHADLHVELRGEMLRKPFGAIYRAMLAARAAEADLKMGELPLYEPLDMRIDQLEDIVQEPEYFSVILQELYHLLVIPRELTIIFVLARVIDRPAVEYIAAAVPRGVERNAFLVSEADYPDFQTPVLRDVVELREGRHLGKYLVEVWVLVEWFLEQQPAEISQRERYAGKKMRLLLEIAPETVGSQNLKHTEENEKTEPFVENLLVYLGIALQSPEVGLDHLHSERLRIPGPGLPDEGGDIIIDRSAAATLEVDEIRGAFLHHDVSCLEVSVHEGVPHVFNQVFLELFEVILKFSLVEVKSRGLEKTVLEIVQIEHYHPGVESRLRIADVEIKPLGPDVLDLRKHLHDLEEQALLVVAVFPALAALRHYQVELVIAEILLKIGHAVRTYGEHLRHTDIFFYEMVVYFYESPVLLERRTYDSDD